MGWGDTVLVAVVHYHLRPGGVTRVIEHALTAVEKDIRFVILAGERPQPDSPLTERVRVVHGLGYRQASPVCPPDVLAERLAAEAKSALGAAPDVWHFHNHSLGKNCALIETVGLLSRQARVLLQIHDFAEDGRPRLFQTVLRQVGNGDVSELGRRVYPQARHIHYAAINSRDFALLSAAGIPESRLHLLPNPVVLSAAPAEMPNLAASDKPLLFLYCTRAIRRKNIGEFLLWASVSEPGRRYAVTLAPRNPLERPVYEQWMGFAEECSLPVEFDLGRRMGQPLAVLLRSAWAAVTTSVAEGFGLAFLEPWLVRTPVLGRKLPEITNEFETAGVDLSALYDRLLLPLSRGDERILLEKIRLRLGAVRSAYGRPVRPGDAEKALSASTEGDRVDFGRLDEELQQKVIRKIAGSRSFRSELRPSDLAPATDMSRAIEKNREVVRQAFSLEQYCRRLMDIYSQLEKSEIEASVRGLDVNKLLDAFLAPERFYLLRSW